MRGKSSAEGEAGVGVIRIEHLRLAGEPGANRVPMQVETAMYLGERFEVVLRRGGWTARAFAHEAPSAEQQLVEFPADALWIF